MPGLYSRAQQIIGEKIFLHDVTIHGDLVLKKHASLYAPVSTEPSLGELHPRGSNPSAWDVSGITGYSLASPYTWDLSASLRVGVTTVKVNVFLYKESTAARDACEVYVWDYDEGVSPSQALVAGPRGMNVPISKMAASDLTSDYHQTSKEGDIRIGSSRKLYIGAAYNVSGVDIYAMWKAYRI